MSLFLSFLFNYDLLLKLTYSFQRDGFECEDFAHVPTLTKSDSQTFVQPSNTAWV